MSTRTEQIRVSDKHGFIHDVTLEHKPHFGFSSAISGSEVIAQVENGKIHEPLSDDDLEWERYEELYGEWTDEVKTTIVLECENYFNTKDI